MKRNRSSVASGGGGQSFNYLTLSGTTFDYADAVGTVIGTISGKTAGSSVALSPPDPHLAIVGTQLRVGSLKPDSPTITIRLVETKPGYTPQITGPITLTISNIPSTDAVTWQNGAAKTWQNGGQMTWQPGYLAKQPVDWQNASPKTWQDGSPVQFQQ